MISSNVGEVIAIFAAAALGLPEILSPPQLLWVNLVTDGLPATALSFNPADPRSMAAPPRGRGDAVVSGWLLARYAAVGAYVGGSTVAGFVWWFVGADAGPRLSWRAVTRAGACGAPDSAACASLAAAAPRSVAVTVLVTVEMFNALNALSEDASLLTLTPAANPWLLAAIATSLALHAAILYVPALAALFGTAPLGAQEWAAVLCLSVPVILLDEGLKAVSRRRAAGRPLLPPAAARIVAALAARLPRSWRCAAGGAGLPLAGGEEVELLPGRGGGAAAKRWAD